MTACLTVVATTDLHGQIRDVDYGRDAPYEDAYGNRIGLARVSSVVQEIRRRAPYALLVDAGDILEGSALAHHYSRRLAEPEPPLHPMAAVMNHLGYDAVALGNHELDYGVAALEVFRGQLDAPLLAGNVLDATGAQAFPGWVIRGVPTGEGTAVRVGIVGLTTAKVTAWNKAVRAHYRFDDPLASAVQQVEQVRAAGAEVVIAVVHSGIEPVEPTSPVEPVETRDNVALDIALSVPGIDVVVAGHAHVEVAERFVVGPDGRQVLLTEPLCWGMRVSVIDLELVHDAHWRVASAAARLADTRKYDEDPDVVRLVADQHDDVRALGDVVVGLSPVRVETEPARYRPASALSLVAAAQAAGARGALRGEAGLLPLLSLVSPTNRFASVAAGPVRRREVAALCQFDSGIVVVEMSGAQLLAHLEHSAAFFAAADGAGPYDPDTLTNAPTPRTPTGTADFDFDVLHGVSARLGYAIDLARPVGDRIRDLTYGGAAMAMDGRFAVAVSRYRASGAAAYPDIADAPVVGEAEESLRQLVERVLVERAWDGTNLASWRLVHDGVPIVLDAD